ncbi:hypothetical protein [Hoyosella altamirensis]|uniref:Low molecular weight antigen MTB12-like C-terminal domain-containing protein n=1 Tax=Hoyosella altamirensis TaxID=616997 RepID=A0A839RPA4_9ACTN|nr:hypothetical protein [Hoyosella altamirensis]MBB3038832.1 hypothetical protein [Hoyosella altamirensis]
MIIAGVAAPALALSACGSDENGEAMDDGAGTTAAPTAECEVPAGDTPTVEELTAILDDALDPSLPTEEKASLIEGGGDDPELWAQLAEQAAQNPDIQYEIPDTPGAVFPLSECEVSVGLTLQISPDQTPNTGPLMFVAEDGQWKLSREDACSFAISFGLETELCP